MEDLLAYGFAFLVVVLLMLLVKHFAPTWYQAFVELTDPLNRRNR